MPDVWTWLTVIAAPLVVLELYALYRHRHALQSPHPPTAHHALTEAILCLDPEGRCTGANLAARRLLQGRPDEITLSDCLPGGTEEASRMLAAVAHCGRVEWDTVVNAQPSPALFHIHALALRDRDNNFWGAALFIGQPVIGSEKAT